MASLSLHVSRLAAVLLVAGCGSGGSGSPEGVLAEIDGEMITEAQVDARIAAIPPLSRPEFSGPIGRKRMLQQILEEEMLYRAAIDEGLDQDAEIRKHLEEYRRKFVVQAYLDRKQEEASRVTDEEIQAFYDTHREDYTTERAYRVRMLMAKTRQRAEQALDLVEQGKGPGQNLGPVCLEEYLLSQLDLIAGYHYELASGTEGAAWWVWGAIFILDVGHVIFVPGGGRAMQYQPCFSPPGRLRQVLEHILVHLHGLAAHTLLRGTQADRASRQDLWHRGLG